MNVCMGIVSPVWWPGMARKVSMEFEMAFNHKFLPALEDAEKLMKDLDLDYACNIMYVHSQIYCVSTDVTVICICMFVSMYVCMCVCMYVSVCMYVNVCMNECVYEYMYGCIKVVCMHV